MIRFTVRDLLWLTVVVAMGFGWYAHRRDNEYRMANGLEQEMEWAAKNAGYTFWRHYDGLYLIPLNKTVHGQPRGWTTEDWHEARKYKKHPTSN
jgi:hypothetical protein